MKELTFLVGSVPSIDTSAARKAVVDGVKLVTEDMTGMVTDMLPYVLVVIGTVVVVFFGIKMFKRFTGK